MAAAIVKEANDPLEEKEAIPVEPLKDCRPPAPDHHASPHGASASAPVEVPEGDGDGDDDDDDDDDGSDWENDSNLSLYEQHILNGEESKYVFEPSPDVCTPEESARYKALLRRVGVEQFVLETITQGTITARKLVTAFGIKPPDFLNGQPDSDYYQLLGLAISRELSKRQRLLKYNTIDDAARLLKSSQSIIVITGAGISTSLGIPDFRSRHTGFYAKLREAGYEAPEDVFEIHAFDDDASDFYKLAGDILPDTKRWTPTHQFIRLLQDKGKLLRNYTQNIDNIEANAGISTEKLVQCHGSWAGATCRKCGYKERAGEGSEMFQYVKRKEIYRCKRCIQALDAPRPGLKRKRSGDAQKGKKKRWQEEDSDSEGQYDIPEAGVMKPDITFFGEQLPNDFFDKIRDEDRFKVDLVIVIGTSMKVAPVSEIPVFLPEETPQIYISRDPIYHIDFDVNLLGYSDIVVTELCRRAGWELKHSMIPPGQTIDVQAEDNEWTHLVRERA